jgi:hypothetical protein
MSCEAVLVTEAGIAPLGTGARLYLLGGTSGAGVSLENGAGRVSRPTVLSVTL